MLLESMADIHEQREELVKQWSESTLEVAPQHRERFLHWWEKEGRHAHDAWTTEGEPSFSLHPAESFPEWMDEEGDDLFQQWLREKS